MQGVCASLQASFGFDVCAIVHDKPGPFTQSPPPPPTPLSPNDVCLTYDFEAPDGKEDVVSFLKGSCSNPQHNLAVLWTDIALS